MAVILPAGGFGFCSDFDADEALVRFPRSGGLSDERGDDTNELLKLLPWWSLGRRWKDCGGAGREGGELGFWERRWAG